MNSFRENVVHMSEEERANYVVELVTNKSRDLAVPPSVHTFINEQIKELDITDPMKLMSDPDSIVANYLNSEYLDEAGITFLMEMINDRLMSDTSNINKAIRQAFMS